MAGLVEAAPDLGNYHREDFYRSGLLLYYRMVPDLSGRERHRAQKRIDRDMDPFSRRRSGELRGRCRLRTFNQTRMAAWRRTQGSDYFWRNWHDHAHSHNLYDQSVLDCLAFRVSNLLLCKFHDHGERAAIRPLQQRIRSEEHTSELQSRQYLVCRLLLQKKKHVILTREIVKNDSAHYTLTIK